MSVDMRRFMYQLDAVKTKANWALESALVRLRAARQELDECLHLIALTRKSRAEAVVTIQSAQRVNLDPRSHASVLDFLLGLDKKLSQLVEHREGHEAAVARARDECTALQKRLEQLDTHREKLLRVFVTTELARQQVASDADWLQRAGWLQQGKEHA